MTAADHLLVALVELRAARDAIRHEFTRKDTAGERDQTAIDLFVVKPQIDEMVKRIRMWLR